MPQTHTRKAGSKLGYGALALYATGLIAMACGVYGFDVPSFFTGGRDSDRVRAQAQNGRMLVITDDRVQCRSIRFNNETAQLDRETLTECGDRLSSGARSSGGSFSIFRDGFVNR